VKLWPRVWCLVFLTHGVVCQSTQLNAAPRINHFNTLYHVIACSVDGHKNGEEKMDPYPLCADNLDTV